MLARRDLICAVGLMLLLTAPVRAETAEPTDAAPHRGATIELDDVGSGELLWRSPQGLVPLPVLDIDVELTVTGVLLRGSVTQVFHNPTSQTIEAIYVFPLPEGATISGHLLAVEMLADAGADLRITGTGAPGFAGKTALELAEDLNRTAIVGFLRKRMGA